MAFLADAIGGQARLYTVNLTTGAAGAGRHDRRWLTDGHRTRPDLARGAACGA